MLDFRLDVQYKNNIQSDQQETATTCFVLKMLMIMFSFLQRGFASIFEEYNHATNAYKDAEKQEQV